MTIISNTFLTFSNTATAGGMREELSDIIYNIAPTQTPFMNGISKGSINNPFFEWQIDTLASAANNAQLEGDDVASFTAVATTVRTGNRAQIARKTRIISGTEDIVKKAGRKSEVAYQYTLIGKELKRDIEFSLCQNTTSVTGNSTTARQTRGLEGWVATNNSLGASGVAPNPGSNTAPTDGTQRDITESLLKTVLNAIFTQGGDPDTVMVGPVNKQKISAFTGNATRMDKSEDSKLVTSVDVYVSDFGELKVVPNRFQRERTAFVLQMDMWKMNFLRPIQPIPLAKTGDAEKLCLIAEYGLQSNQEAASGAIRDLTTS